MIKTLLDEELTDEFNTLKNMTLGTKEYEVTVNTVTKLVQTRVELDRYETERMDKLNLQEEQAKQKEQELNLQKEQAKNEKVHNTSQTLIMIGTALLTAVITIWGTNKTLKFEEEGTVTTSAGKSFLGRLIPKK